ncbi:MAG TPA: hypothetical protein VJ323_12985 [Bryobacteraceae bacterium]|nr:hypothetical protein [Bryobacteraceae bacterium]
MDGSTFVQIILAGFTAVCGGAGVYAAIKGDLARTRAIAENAASSANKAHDRIDELFSHHRSK